MKQTCIFILFVFVIYTVANAIDSTQTESGFLTWLKGTPDSPYKLSWGLDISMAATGLSLQLLSNTYKPHYTSYTVESLAKFSKDDVNAFDRSAVGPIIHRCDSWSNVTNVLIANYIWLMLPGKESRKDFTKVIVMYLQLYCMTPLISQWVQPAIGRKRPYFYSEEEDIKTRLSDRAQTSMPSSHATFAFANAVLTSSVFRTYYPESPWRYAVWSLSLGTATATCILRYRAHKHFPTDLLAGAATGSLIGWFVHFTHRNREKRKVAIGPIIGNKVGIQLTYGFSGKQ